MIQMALLLCVVPGGVGYVVQVVDAQQRCLRVVWADT
jgi:hypothetical protein